MFIKKIKNWDNEEQVVMFKVGSPTEDCGKAIYELDAEHLIYHDGKNSIVYTYESGNIEVKEHDIITISENGMIIRTHYSYGSEVDIFVTNHCNSNCIMCPLSEYSRKKKSPQYNQWLMKYIQALPREVGFINVTGGEPTLAGEYFIDVMDTLREKFQKSGFQLLTNGRSAADFRFLKNVLHHCPSGMLFAIPLHSCIPEIHDEITQSKGSFVQTDQGIKNLLKLNQRVEVRIVLSKVSIETAEKTAEYIIENYKGLTTVNFVAMEMMGNAVINREKVWIDYDSIFVKIRTAIDQLIKNGFDVKLYNFPLCMIKKGYWHIAAKSISGYKIQYQDDCLLCEAKDICGGFFSSTKKLMNPKVYPINRSELQL